MTEEKRIYFIDLKIVANFTVNNTFPYIPRKATLREKSFTKISWTQSPISAFHSVDTSQCSEQGLYISKPKL